MNARISRIEQPLPSYEQARRWANNRRASRDFVIVDTETTSLRGYMCQIAIIDSAGNELLNTLVNPLVPITPQAHAVHGIDSAMVASAPHFADIAPLIENAFKDKHIIAYHAPFDYGRLDYEHQRLETNARKAGHPYPCFDFGGPYGRQGSRWHCAMRWYARYYGEWSHAKRDYIWQRLPYAEHRAREDCTRTLALIHGMASGTLHTYRSALRDCVAGEYTPLQF